MTDYTSKTESTLSGNLGSYRLVHWMIDILKNMFIGSMNIFDERLRSLVCGKDGLSDDRLNAMLRVGTPMDREGIYKASTTPAILVNVGEVHYAVPTLNNLNSINNTAIGTLVRHGTRHHRTTGLKIAVVTESEDGTLLLTDTIEDFLITYADVLIADNNTLNTFKVQGISAPQEIPTDTAHNGKPLYQQVISVVTVGSVARSIDTQGPVYRGVRVTRELK